jgi:hypothetical protein
MWRVNIRTQLVSNLKAQRQYKENVDGHHKDQPNFKVGEKVWFR